MRERIEAARRRASEALLNEIGPEGHWTGELSSSALSTATAVVALWRIGRTEDLPYVAGGLAWLSDHANGDGGWGDTVRSKSNISTTALCWAALSAGGAVRPEVRDRCAAASARAEEWLAKACGLGDGRLETAPLVRAIESRYGKDRTFSVPILVMCQLAGRLGADGWKHISALPLELAALPHQFFGAMQLPVVSYALPALIALGQVIHHHHPSGNPLVRLIRSGVKRVTLRKLSEIQPPNGGFLEATPLTSFVTMSLAAMGLAGHPVAVKGADFLRQAMRDDGSWAIDSNLATWVTTLAVKALSEAPGVLSPEKRTDLRSFLLDQQYRETHLYTHAAPGGWAWTNLPGGVPDADDTAGALLALLRLGAMDGQTLAAGSAGIRWLLDLQNRDGGIPTFCRGWGALPFDCSSPDLTAHALRAWSAWHPHLDPGLRKRIEGAVKRARKFLLRSQRADGSWVPLWFGHEEAPNDENPTYGTTHVLMALRELRDRGFTVDRRSEEAGTRWLLGARRADGAWGGCAGVCASMEETALALEALGRSEHTEATRGATEWLLERVEAEGWREPAPIGFYFAKLWYFERLYPLIFTVAALNSLPVFDDALEGAASTTAASFS